MNNQPFLYDDDFFKSNEMTEGGAILKAKTAMPIGTISKGRKKVGPNRWVPVSSGKRQKNDLPDEGKKKKQEIKNDAGMTISEYFKKDTGANRRIKDKKKFAEIIPIVKEAREKGNKYLSQQEDYVETKTGYRHSGEGLSTSLVYEANQFLNVGKSLLSGSTKIKK